MVLIGVSVNNKKKVNEKKLFSSVIGKTSIFGLKGIGCSFFEYFLHPSKKLMIL